MDGQGRQQAVEQTEISTAKAMAFGLAIQGVVLAVAVVCLYLSAVDVAWPARGGVLGPFVLGVTGALVTYLVCALLTRSNTVAGARLRDHCEALQVMFGRFSWGQIGLLALAAGVCEELLFRGFLQPWLTSLSSPLVGILVASVIFGLLHYASFFYFFITFVIGVILGVVYWASESLLLVVVWHAVYDLIAMGVLAKFPGYLKLNVAHPSP